ncbi:MULTISPECIES: hypothetical protein [Flavobacterium]|uniref:Uncharacterized protein n=1 Tax=Flavobacterium lipolyticum TaxID=2893754 RepID=A0ABS8LZ01_9FLAO|nr:MULTISPECIES: hypothetical protein [unclassified Flavobacterium]MCC9017819.1 hypothetical protein [Flavobacterium sp. F-126]
MITNIDVTDFTPTSERIGSTITIFAPPQEVPPNSLRVLNAMFYPVAEGQRHQRPATAHIIDHEKYTKLSIQPSKYLEGGKQYCFIISLVNEQTGDKYNFRSPAGKHFNLL